MSSHHVIRENQEGSLVLLDRSAIDLRVLESFLEWSPIVITNADTFKILNAKGVKIDVVICSEKEKAELDEEFSYQHPIEIIINVDPQLTIDLALRNLKNRNSAAVYLIDKIEPSMMFQIQTKHRPLQIDFVCKDQLCHIPTQGHYEKWFPANSKLSIISKAQGQIFTIKLPNKLSEEIRFGGDRTIFFPSEGNIQVTSPNEFIVKESII